MDRLRAFWARNLINKAIVLIALLSTACCCLAILIPGRGQRAPAAAGPTAAITTAAVAADPTAPAPTAEPTPAPTEEPTAVPTEAPAPTEAPTAAPAGATDEERAYAAAVGKQGGAIGPALREIGTLLSAPQLTDQNWILRMAAQTVTIELAHKALVDYEPVPASAAELHRAITRATGRCAEAMDPLRRGIDGRDTALIIEAGQGIQECNQLLNEAQPLITTWIAERGA